MPSVCKRCGCSDIDTDPARGDAVCTKCGSVVDEHLIVSEVEFEENSAGGANVIGQFVSAEGSNTLSLGQNFKHSLGRDSRQQIFNNGGSRKEEEQSMWLEHASISFAEQRKHHREAILPFIQKDLLIDISDVTQTDVFTLGRTFLALSRELCIDVPTTDPSLYIHRFAHQLKFGEKENEVSTTALRLVSRMKRDWLSTGRRPSGLCGAALIVASRLHGFNRSVKDVVKVVRLSHTTILQRLADFGKTASSKLTVDEFNKIDLEEEADPPSFTRARQRAKQAQMYDESIKYSSPELLAQLASTQERVEAVLAKRKMIEDDIANRETILPSTEVRRKMIRSRLPIQALNLSQNNCKGEKPDSDGNEHRQPREDTDVKIGAKDDTQISTDSGKMEDGKKNCRNASENDVHEKELLDMIAIFNETQKDGEDSDDGIKDSAGTENSNSSANREERNESCKTEGADKNEGEEENQELDWEETDDSEIEDCLLGEDEVEIKTKIWMEENGEFMEKLREKEEKAALELEAKIKTEGNRKKKTRKKKNKTTADTADEAIKTMLQERKLSSKINYDVLRDLAAEGGVEIKDPVKLEPKLETDEKKPEVLKTVCESGPVESKLKFRAGLKRPTNIQNINTLAKKLKTESSSSPSRSSVVLPVKKEVCTKDNSNGTLEKMNQKPSGESKVVLHSTVVEDGPVVEDVDDYDNEAESEEEMENMHVSASQLFGRGDVEDGYNEDGYERFGDEFY